MQAVKMSGIDTKVVNGAFPDTTNVVLGKVGLAPTCGGGNMDMGVYRLKRIIARDLGVPFQSVTIYVQPPRYVLYKRLDGPFKLNLVEENITSNATKNRRCTTRQIAPLPNTKVHS
jgi:hypothetical protein